MSFVQISVLATIILAALTTSVQAKIYPDQLIIDTLGDDTCRSGYRPIDRFEAAQQKDYLIARMGQWQITGLQDNWVIMGANYYGQIKQDLPNHQTWCYPKQAISEIPRYALKSISEGNELDIQHQLVTNQENFVRPISYLAHYLGYAWVGGNHSQYVGEDMDIRRECESWVIQGNSDGTCNGYRCDEKTKITIGNFAYTLNNNNFWHGLVTESEQELVKTITAVARNYTDVPQQVVVDLKVDESTNWSKSNSFGFAQKVATENTFKWPLVGDTKLTISLEANQSFSSTNGGSSSEHVTLQARPTVPANSEIPIRVELYRSTISYPYRFGANLSYDIEFNGFLRWSGNAWSTHPENRPTRAHTFTIGRTGNNSADLRYQWDHRYIPGEVKWWDWSWAINEHGLSNMQYVTGASLRPFHSYVSGDFYAESQFAGNIEIGQATPVENKSSLNRNKHSTSIVNYKAGQLDVSSNFDQQELELLGFTNAKLTITPAE
ncbi:aerolysin family beta-barrel pore-forming toxin [Vibrio pectenicida]|uniref:aerolysin family beta-barrel pore-forming toxin n=1 Tax=Vibrio pectenicida TaxID=62763 RepID=UPI003B9CD137